MTEYQGAFGAPDWRKAPCPECDKDTRVDTLFEKIDRWEIDEGLISGVFEYYVFQCRGCEAIFFAKSSGDSEDYYDYVDQFTGEHERIYKDRKAYFPAVAQTPVPSWAGLNLALKDSTLHDLLHSIYTAMNHELGVLAAIGMRTAFDRVSELLGVDTNLNFDEKLEQMRKGGHISGVQKGVLEVLVDAGSAAAHRGWKPSETHLATMKEILEALVRDHFVLKPEVDKLRKSIPSKSSSI